MPATDLEPAGPPDRSVYHLAAVTPSDSADLAYVSRAFHVGTAGDVTVTTLSGEKVTITGATAGWHPIRVTRIWATGTTATGITVGW